MTDMGGLPRLPAICSQCGEPFWERACGPTHALIWWSITEPVLFAMKSRNQPVGDRREPE